MENMGLLMCASRQCVMRFARQAPDNLGPVLQVHVCLGPILLHERPSTIPVQH